MEIIILILLYVLSVIITRYAHIKSDFTEPIHLIICLLIRALIWCCAICPTGSLERLPASGIRLFLLNHFGRNTSEL